MLDHRGEATRGWASRLLAVILLAAGLHLVGATPAIASPINHTEPTPTSALAESCAPGRTGALIVVLQPLGAEAAGEVRRVLLVRASGPANTYTYVNGNPINAWDPSGHRQICGNMPQECDDAPLNSGSSPDPQLERAQGKVKAEASLDAELLAQQIQIEQANYLVENMPADDATKDLWADALREAIASGDLDLLEYHLGEIAGWFEEPPEGSCAASSFCIGVIGLATDPFTYVPDPRECVGSEAKGGGCALELAGIVGVGKVAKLRELNRISEGIADGAGAGNRACRTNSFTGETLVLMADGEAKAIRDVQLGDVVHAVDPTTGESGPRSVTDLIRSDGLHSMVEIRLDGGSRIDATDGHPFWVEGRGEWVDAIDLQPGDVLLTADGVQPRVAAVRVAERDLTAYNLSVAGLHTYFAGSRAVLVHNCAAVASMTSQIKKAGLTSTGKIRFVPPKGASTLVRGPNKGYIDRFGNEWTKGPSRTPGEAFEWDVIPGQHAPTWFRELAKDGTHVNVSLGGVVTHR